MCLQIYISTMPTLAVCVCVCARYAFARIYLKEEAVVTATTTTRLTAPINKFVTVKSISNRSETNLIYVRITFSFVTFHRAA